MDDTLLKQQVIQALKSCYDPELQIDIWNLGLIYNVKVNLGIVEIRMTLTTPFCPYGPELMDEIESKIKNEKGIKKVKIELVFDPPWQPSDELKAMLGI